MNIFNEDINSVMNWEHKFSCDTGEPWGAQEFRGRNPNDKRTTCPMPEWMSRVSNKNKYVWSRVVLTFVRKI